MSTTETKVRPQWTTQHTAGHETHGQTAIYDETTGKDVAIVYDGAAHAELIVRAVNSHADMLEALESIVRKLVSNRGIFEIPVEEKQARAAIAKARGGAA